MGILVKRVKNMSKLAFTLGPTYKHTKSPFNINKTQRALYF